MTEVEFDPRVGWATVTDGPPELIGPIVRVDLVQLDGRDVFLPKPHPGLPEYVTAARAEAHANELRLRLLEGLDEKPGTVPYQPDAAHVFDYQAAAASAVMSAVTGLEAFGNHLLAGHCPPGKAVVYNGGTYTLPDLRDVPLNERIGEVLPALHGVPRPTGEAWWPTLRRVQGLAALNRHAVDDAVPRKGLTGTKPLVQRFCDREYRGAAGMMLQAFAYFEPNWIEPERLAQLPPPPA